MLVPTGTKNGCADSEHEGQQAAGCCNLSAAVKYVWRVGVKRKPPAKEGPWRIDGIAKEYEPRLAELPGPSERGCG